MAQQRWMAVVVVIGLGLTHAEAADKRLELDTLTVFGQKAMPALVFNPPWQSSEPPRLKPLPQATPDTIRPIEQEEYMLWLQLRTGQGTARPSQ